MRVNQVGQEVTGPGITPSGAYARQIDIMGASLAAAGAGITFPYNGEDDALSVTEPSTAGATDPQRLSKFATDVYNSFVSARQNAQVADPPNCSVYVYDSANNLLATANVNGVQTQ